MPESMSASYCNTSGSKNYVGYLSGHVTLAASGDRLVHISNISHALSFLDYMALNAATRWQIVTYLWIFTSDQTFFDAVNNHFTRKHI